MLSLFTVRLTRIADRASTLDARVEKMRAPGTAELYLELAALSRRSRLIDRAIALATIAGLLICLVIAVLFVDYLLVVNLSLPIALLFLVAMLCFIVAFGSFLHEVLLARARPVRKHSTGVAIRTDAVPRDAERRDSGVAP